MQREVGRSSYGGIFVSRQGFGQAKVQDDWNRAYGFDANVQVTTNQRVSAFIARTDTPTSRTSGPRGSDYSGRAFYNFTNKLWQISGGYSQVGDNFNPEVGFLPRRGYWRPEFRTFFQPQPKRWPWIRRIAPISRTPRSAICRPTRCRARTGIFIRSRFSRGRADALDGSLII